MNDVPLQRVTRRPIPSHTATKRLMSGMRAEVNAYRHVLDRDLQRASDEEAAGSVDEAAATLLAHIAKLEALRSHVNHLVAEAVVQRDAEAVLDSVCG